MAKKLLSFGVAVVLCMAATEAARANITFNFSASGTGNNVLFDNGLTAYAGVALVGTTQQTSTNVDFIGNETLATQANGQARITGAADQTLNFIDISLQQANTGFTSLVFDLNGLPQLSGTATITAYDQFGNPFVGTIASLSSGNNFVTVTASNGELITDVKVSTTSNFGDLEQVRLGGAQAVAVPAPVAGAGVPGLIAACGALIAFARRRRKVAR